MIETGSALAIDKHSRRIVHINDVPRGNACNCCCIHCGGDLQARKGEERSHHFKHITGIECNAETVLHSLAKRIFLDNDYVRLPDEKGVFRYHTVTAEVWLDDQRPDIILAGRDGTLHVEIAVTSFITPVKKEKIIGRQYPTVEIDLSQINRDSGYDELCELLIEEIANKKIIYWPNIPVKETPSKEDEGGLWLMVFIFIIGLFGLRRCFKGRRKK